MTEDDAARALLDRYLDGALTDGAARDLERRLETDADLARLLRRLEDERAALKALFDLDASRGDLG